MSGRKNKCFERRRRDNYEFDVGHTLKSTTNRPRHCMYFAKAKPMRVSFTHAAGRGGSFGKSRLAKCAEKSWLLLGRPAE